MDATDPATRLRRPLGWVALVVTAAVVALPIGHAAAADDIIITLKNEFIEKYRKRATIEATYTVDTVGPVHSAADDGDMHFSGRAPEIELPAVAEIMNAKDQDDAVLAVRAARGKEPIKLAGAWRLWCEHANSGKQVQGAALSPFDKSNPPHVFEIHPVTAVAGMPILGSVRGIPGFRYKDATESFQHYENAKCKIRPNANGTTTLRTQGVGYNYVDFILESLEEQEGGFAVEDGRFLKCDVRDTDGELITRNIRMVFIKGTKAEKTARLLHKDGRLRVVGIPRIDLALVAWRVEHKDDPKWKDDEPLEWNLPYEIVVVAVLAEH